MTDARPARILVVDDTDYNREVMVRILEREGHRVATAGDGGEALRRLREESWDLVLLDVMMPGLDGVQVLETLRDDEQLRHIPVIMLSALTDQERIVQCIQLGAEDYLPKPVNQQLLRARIAASLERKRLHDLERDYLQRVEAISAQLQAANEQLRRANQLKSRFLATAAHDLKNPLGGILLLADRIRAEAEAQGAEGGIPQQATRIREGVQRMLQTLNGLLDTAVQEMGAIALNLEEVNLGDLVHEVVQVNEPYAASKDIRLHYRETLGGECWSLVDRLRLAQAVDNLVNNAIKYSPFGRNVWVELSLRVDDGTDRAHLEVRDEGPGFSPEDLQRAFGLFQRLSAQPTAGEYSTGLGLSIVKQMVELHGGWVDIDSQPGQGATFRVELPLKVGAGAR